MTPVPLIELLLWSSLVIGAAGVLSAVVLATRRIQIRRFEQRRAALQARLRPVALALVAGEATRPLSPTQREAEVLANLVGEYARLLSGEACKSLAVFLESQGYVAEELRALRRRSWPRRATAAYALGDMGSRAAIPALISALSDRERDVRAAAVRSLGRLGATEAVDDVVRALAHKEVPRAVAAQAVLAIGPAAVPSLRGLVEGDDRNVRGVAVDLLGFLGGAPEVAIVSERLHDASADVRAGAARALGRLGGREASAELQAALADRVPFVRGSVAAALGKIGDRGATVCLLAQARSDDFWSARAAARALAELDPVALRAAASMPDAGAHLREAAALTALEGT